MIIDKAHLKSVIEEALLKRSVPKDTIDIVFNIFMDAEIRGKKSHGFSRFLGTARQLMTFDGKIPQPKSVTISDALVKVDACGTIGTLAVTFACEELLKMNQQAIKAVAVSGFVSTTGALGYYARYLANQKLVSIVLANAKSAVAPYGGIKPVIGTNPLAIGIPFESNPIIADMSTAAMTYGSILLAQRENQLLPDGVLIDGNGNSTNNPFDVVDGCQLPLAGPKGFALGLAIEILAGAFIGAKSGNNVAGTEGILIIALDFNAFTPESILSKNLKDFISEVINTEKSDAYTNIRVPGDNLQAVSNQATIEVSDTFIDELEKLSHICSKLRRNNVWQ